MTGKRLHPRRRAFSLVEMASVVAIIAVFSAIAMPRYANSISLARLNAATNRIIRDAALARQRAMSSSKPQLLVFSGLTYSIPGLTSLNHDSSNYSVDLSAEPYLANSLSANLGGDAQVTFNIYGVPDSGGTISLTVGANTRVLTLDSASGLVTAP